MKKKKTIYKPVDAAPYLDNDAVIAEYLSAAPKTRTPRHEAWRRSPKT